MDKSVEKIAAIQQCERNAAADRATLEERQRVEIGAGQKKPLETERLVVKADRKHQRVKSERAFTTATEAALQAAV